MFIAITQPKEQLELRTDEAEERVKESIMLAQKLGYQKGEAAAWNGLAVVEEIRGNYKAAIGHYEQALA